MLKYLIFLLIISCVPQGGNITIGPSSQGAFAPSPDITHLTVAGSKLILDGSNFESVTHVNIKDPSNGSVKPFKVISATFSKLISESINAASIPMEKGLDLILSNAFGQSTFPVTFSLQPNSIDNTHIIDGEVTISKLDPGGAQPGDVIKWDGTQFNFSPDLSGGGGGGGGSVTMVDAGAGLVGAPDPIISAGMLSVDTGTTGSPSRTKIPFFNSTFNQLEIGGTAEILFSDPSTINFSLFNNSGQFTIQKGNVSPAYFIMHPSGRVEVPVELFVKGFPVCNSNGDDCPAAFGSAVTNITVTPPLTGGGSGPTVNISPGLVNTPGNLVVLDGTGGLPIGIKGVVNSVTAGTSTYVSPASTGAVTVGVVFGAGNAQRYQTYLDNLGTLNPNDNFVIIGNGTGWEVQGGDSLLITLDAQKADPDLSKLAALIPYSAPDSNMIVGSPLGWITQTVPNCTTGNVVIGDGSFLSCSPNTWDFSGGTFTTYDQVGLQIRAETSAGTPTGELRFFGSNNTNYVGLKAASGVASNTIWTLPLGDGTPGFALTTNGTGALTWTNVGGINDVSNPGTSTMGNLASFSNGTGKVIQDSGINASNVVTNSGTSTDKAIVRFNGTGGKLIQNSNVVISDTDFLTGVSGIYIDNNTTPAGTNTPFSTLDVIGNITTSNHGNNSQHHATEISSKRIGHISGNNLEFAGMQLNVSATDSTGAARANSSNIAFYTWGLSILPSREVARITEFGRLGIGTTNPTELLDVAGNVRWTGNGLLTGTSVIEFGSDVAGQEINAGKIGYQTFTAGALDILGAGTASPNRLIKLWDDVLINDALQVQGQITTGSGGTSYNFPSTRGGNGQVLKTDGSGNLSWQNDIDTDTDTDTDTARNGGWVAGSVPTGGHNGDCKGRLLAEGSLCAINLWFARGGASVFDGTQCTLPVNCSSIEGIYFYGRNKENNQITWKVQGRTVTLVSGGGSLDCFGTTVFPAQ